mgnify:CR=1 FL=1
MSLNIAFYANANDNRVVDKVLTPTFTSVAELYSDSSIHEPQIKLAWNEALSQSNYMYIGKFHRYYYIKDVVALTGGAMLISGKVDPLMSFADSIKLSNAIMTRSQRSGFQGRNKGTYVRDPKLPVYPKKNFKVVEFSNSVFNIDVATHSSFNFVLNVAGGGNGGSGQ